MGPIATKQSSARFSVVRSRPEPSLTGGDHVPSSTSGRTASGKRASIFFTNIRGPAMGSHHVAVPRSMRRAAGEFPCRPGLFVEWTRYNDLPRLAMPESVLPLANPAMHSIRASSRWPRHAAIEERSFSFREAAPLSPVWPRALGSHLRSAMARGATARPLRKQIERPLQYFPDAVRPDVLEGTWAHRCSIISIGDRRPPISWDSEWDCRNGT